MASVSRKSFVYFFLFLTSSWAPFMAQAFPPESYLFKFREKENLGKSLPLFMLEASAKDPLRRQRVLVVLKQGEKSFWTPGRPLYRFQQEFDGESLEIFIRAKDGFWVETFNWDYHHWTYRERADDIVNVVPPKSLRFPKIDSEPFDLLIRDALGNVVLARWDRLGAPIRLLVGSPGQKGKYSAELAKLAELKLNYPDWESSDGPSEFSRASSCTMAAGGGE